MNLLNNRLLKTELVEWKKLIPFQPDNLKKTEPHKLQKLANSLCENGFSMNFYVWEKDGKIFIIDGHSRQEVLQLLESGAIYPKDPSGKEYQVAVPEKFPCSFLHLKNKSEAKKAVLIYNSKYKSIDSDILSEWVSDLSLDELKSQIEIPELKLDFDMPQDLESDSIDDAAKITTNIKLGDLIEIGRHRLLCGDSTKKEDVERLMDRKKADVMITDPPYNFHNGGGGYFGEQRKELVERMVKIVDFDPNCFNQFKNLEVGSFYIFCNKDLIKQYLDIYKDYYFNILIWQKTNAPPMVSNSFIPDIEYILYFHNSKKRIYNNGLSPVTIYSKVFKSSIQEGHKDQDKFHPTPKPIEMINNYILISSKVKGIVMDLFLGSGSTMVACQTLDRICYGMELEPIYCQVIINRMRKNFPELEIKVNGQIYAE